LIVLVYMPELPEVESLRRSLLPFLIGQKILNVKVNRHKIVSSSGTTRKDNLTKTKEFETELIDRKIVSLERRAKNIIIRLDDESIILIHLKMTGQLVYQPKFGELVTGGHPIQESDSVLPNKHSYVIWTLSDGTLFYNDVRQFGYVLYYSNFQAVLNDGHFVDLGVEPLEESFTLQEFSKIKKKTGVLKSVLLGQGVVVGLGNIYCDEVCFAAKVRPDRKCNTLTKKEIERLYIEIKRILHLAVENNGSSVANYLLGDGSKGNYANFHLVYGKKGKNCVVCGTPLSDSKINSRTTIFCKKCQK
jgi:formamidopyrimidine-DNA glycosylase